ncbi:CAAX amino protease [Synergistales bacterium]|nr:CAAX amino protease [Synergistales bacterium]
MSIIKTPKTYKEQIEKLRLRGCFIDDDSFAENVLSHINYYRLSAYFLPFRQNDESYITGTNFRTVYRIYEFDRNMRNILFAAIGKIEIFLRAKFAYYHAHQYGALGYKDSFNYNKTHKHNEFLIHLDSEIDKNKKVAFVKHHIENYNRKFPIWVIVDLFTFGMLSYFYADMKTRDQKYLAKDLFGLAPQVLRSFLRCCTDLRNICAHYGRLYFRVFSAVPSGFLNIPEADRRRLFGAVMMLKILYADTDSWSREVHSPLRSLIAEYKSDIELYHIGFPEDWEKYIVKRV